MMEKHANNPRKTESPIERRGDRAKGDDRPVEYFDEKRFRKAVRRVIREFGGAWKRLADL